ncbi:MAG: sigma-54-dependent Fis family transcriptional regulator [FCB group bacterium]|nr:sigma-54-dependent Fis family transcriptional regulator [FCB group bacterium]
MGAQKNTTDKNINVFVVDDDKYITSFLDEYLSGLEFNVVTETDPVNAETVFQKNDFDIVMLDINMPKISGLKLLELFKKANPDVAVIMISGLQDVDMVVKCIQLGAYDYIAKPLVDLNQIKVRIDRALSERSIKRENIQLKTKLTQQSEVPEFQFRSAAMRKILDMIKMVAQYDSTVLISGESGTGKEVATRTLHKFSLRSEKPFVAVNCGSIPETLLESTLFGYEKGAFTGANTRQAGLFEESNHGTIFLDEITETTPEFQIRLLRVLEDSTIRRVGGTKETKLDLRIVAATNLDIKKKVEDGDFREDLYYRLNVFHIAMPPLRDRKDDIPVIANYHLNKLAKKMNKGEIRLSPEVLEIFARYDWKGNVRELINVLENALIMCPGEEIVKSDLPGQLNSANAVASAIPSFDGELGAYDAEKFKFEFNYFSRLLDAAGGNISKAAKMAGYSRQHLHLKLKNLNIN